MKDSVMNRARYVDGSGADGTWIWRLSSEIGWMKWAKKREPARKARWYLRGLRWRKLEDGQRRLLTQAAGKVFG